jgi:hypothetical protein
MASGKWLVASGLILLIGVQAAFAKKDAVAKDSVKTTAAEKDETIVKASGTLEVGFDNKYKYKDKYGNDKKVYEYNRIGKAEVDISFRPVKKVRAEIGFEYNHKKDSLLIDKLYGQYSFANFSTARFGYMKKSFGLEERTSLDERYFHKRSIISDSLEGFGFLGHDLTLQYRHDLSKKVQLRGGFSWTEDSLNYLQNYSVEYNGKKNNLILAAIVKHYLPPGKDMITTFISSLSFKRTDKLFLSEAELISGTNPIIKACDGSYGRVYSAPPYTNDNYDCKNIDAIIFAARLKENFIMNTGASILQQFIPVTEAAFYSSDLDSSDFDMQFRAGLTLGFAKNSSVQWRNNYGVVSKIRNGEKELWRRRFDSEVVVVF